MKLKRYIVNNFRSVWNSGEINIDDKVTCFVGKNESGKTVLLQALYRTKPINTADATFDLDDDYPRRALGDYRHDIKNDSTVKQKKRLLFLANTRSKDNDEKVVSDVFGRSVIDRRETFILNAYYGVRG